MRWKKAEEREKKAEKLSHHRRIKSEQRDSKGTLRLKILAGTIYSAFFRYVAVGLFLPLLLQIAHEIIGLSLESPICVDH